MIWWLFSLADERKGTCCTMSPGRGRVSSCVGEGMMSCFRMGLSFLCSLMAVGGRVQFLLGLSLVMVFLACDGK